MHRFARVHLLLCAFLFLPAAPRAQTDTRASAVRIVQHPDNPRRDDGTQVGPGEVVMTVGGKTRVIERSAWRAWRIENGRAVLWSGKDGAGGFENEGESLWRYDVATGKKTLLLREPVMIEDVREVRSRSGRLALLVRTADGGAGMERVLVVHPTRGKVWERVGGHLRGVANGRLTVAVYPDVDQWFYDPPKGLNPPVGKPNEILTLDLDALLKRPPLPFPKPERM